MARPRGLRFQRTSGRGQRRRVSWGVGPEGVVSASASVVSIFPTGAQALLDDLTVVRLRGELLLQLRTAAAVLDGFQYAAGICIVTENAFGVGVTAVPAPLDDIAWDGWFWHMQGTVRSITTTVVEGSRYSGDRVVVDSKAMRKLHQTDIVIAVVQTVETGDAVMQFDLWSRLLAKLP